jgi:hypothetical protein
LMFGVIAFILCVPQCCLRSRRAHCARRVVCGWVLAGISRNFVEEDDGKVCGRARNALEGRAAMQELVATQPRFQVAPGFG